MNIAELLIRTTQSQEVGGTLPKLDKAHTKQSIHENQLMALWEQILNQSGFRLQSNIERSSLTDAVLWPMKNSISSPFLTETPIHVKVIGRHVNGSFRCHIGTGKACRPIQSVELCRQMRLLAVFFKTESSKSQHVSPDFLFFPTWLLHLFRYSEHGSTPGRTDVRFLENTALAKEDHIYRLNNVLNTLFRFNLHSFEPEKLRDAVELANFLFDVAGFNHHSLPRPIAPGIYQTISQPHLYHTMLTLLQEPRPAKVKSMCHNCNSKPASRRRLCVACYRYQLKYSEPRPLRLIIANRSHPRAKSTLSSDDQIYPTDKTKHTDPQFSATYCTSQNIPSQLSQKHCANCGVTETHQWYRNLCGKGHWCETCKSYYLRHSKVRPRELFIKAAKYKFDMKNIVNWTSWPADQVTSAAHCDSRRSSSSSIASPKSLNDSVLPVSRAWSDSSYESSSPNSSNMASAPTTPLQQHGYFPSLSTIHQPVGQKTYPFDHDDEKHELSHGFGLLINPKGYFIERNP